MENNNKVEKKKNKGNILVAIIIAFAMILGFVSQGVSAFATTLEEQPEQTISYIETDNDDSETMEIFYDFIDNNFEKFSSMYRQAARKQVIENYQNKKNVQNIINKELLRLKLKEIEIRSLVK